MKTRVLRRNYNPSDSASVGWSIEWHGGRLMAELRSRWQGSSDGVRILLGRGIPLDAAKELAKMLDNERLANIWDRLVTGESMAAFWQSSEGTPRLTSRGHEVQ